MVMKITLTQSELKAIEKVASKEAIANTTAERVDLHGEALKLLMDIILGKFDKNKDYSTKNKRTKI